MIKSIHLTNKRLFFVFIFLFTLSLVKVSQSAVMYGVSVGGNRDYPGSNYAEFQIDSLEKCVKQCANDSRCLAFSYDPRISLCKLKDSVPEPVRKRRIKSGRKLVQHTPPPKQPPTKPEPEVYPPDQPYKEVDMEILQDTYFKGGEYRTLKVSHYSKCSRICNRDDECKFFSYRQRTKRCELKSYKRKTVERLDSVSGIKLYYFH